MNEVRKRTKLTKKAVDYYIEQELVSPSFLENGYRDFSDADVQQLKKIATLRRLGLHTGQIKAVLSDSGDETLLALSTQKELETQREQAKKDLLNQLAGEKSYDEIEAALETLEQSACVAEKLRNAFPGFFGRFVCLHFSRFLMEPAVSKEQKAAYEEILQFLDQVPPLSLPPEVQAYWEESTKQISTDSIQSLLEQTRRGVENPEEFLQEQQEAVEQYLAFKNSPDYPSSLYGKLFSAFQAFQQACGYNDRFLPAMKRLSPSYSDYVQQMELANEKLLQRYPQIKGL